MRPKLKPLGHHKVNDSISPHVSGSIDLGFNGNIATIILNNPGKKNALSLELWEQLPILFDRAVERGSRVITLAGVGENFCSGADISEFDKVRENAETAQRYERANEAAFSAVRNAPLPVIAQIQGICFGGGFGLAAACDIRIATEDAQFCVPPAKLGLAYPLDAMADIVNAVGAQNAKRLLYTAERCSAKQMLAMGFLSEVIAPERIDHHVSGIAENIASLAPLTHQATKAAVAAALGGDKQPAEQLGTKTFTSTDYAEGRAAFREKRPPKFNGA